MKVEKMKEEILKELDDLLVNPLNNMGIATLPGDSKRTIVSFLSSSLNKISAEAYREGWNDCKKEYADDTQNG